MPTKLCPKCQTTKSTQEFYSDPKRKDGLYGYCKQCFDSINEARRDALKSKAIIYKGSKCQRCKIPYPETPSCVFDFHHRDPSTKIDWTGIRRWGWQRIQQEIDKCDLLCANCHRIVEYGA